MLKVGQFQFKTLGKLIVYFDEDYFYLGKEYIPCWDVLLVFTLCKNTYLYHVFYIVV